MSDRFYLDCPLASPDAKTVLLEGSEAHHLLHVMRAQRGDQVTLFDGTGREYLAEVEAMTRREVTLALLATQEVDRESSVDIALGVAFPKGDRQKVLVEKLTELGVRRLTPLITQRSVATLRTSGLEKLRRSVIEASKQCGRNRLMTIEQPTPLETFLQHAEAEARLFAHPGIETKPLTNTPSSVVIAIGPEGGFAESELEAASQSGWQGLVLGRSILRVETAAIAAAARLMVG